MPKGLSKKGRGKGGRRVQKENDAPKHDEIKGKEEDGGEWEDEDNDVAMMDCEEDYDYIRRAEEEEEEVLYLYFTVPRTWDVFMFTMC